MASNFIYTAVITYYAFKEFAFKIYYCRYEVPRLCVVMYLIVDFMNHEILECIFYRDMCRNDYLLRSNPYRRSGDLE